ncbi:hypothetical protein LIER_36685 [Lithospermum erythrorhizon]|uniref:Uncharacterized protein n=1 Tax=Lithospermum erythrorhizon TaxID=34254 RepID=A0AAV3PD97_LITER
MVIFKTTPGREFSTLCIVDPKEYKVTIMVSQALLYRGCAAKWPFFAHLIKREVTAGLLSKTRFFISRDQTKSPSTGLGAFIFWVARYPLVMCNVGVL